MSIQEGKLAPDFTLSDEKGEDVTMSSLRGKHVILYFYPKDDSSGCTKESCGFRDIWGEMQKQGAVVIGVSPDGAASHQAFASKYELPFTLLSDPDRTVLTEYEAYGDRTNDGKTTMGVIRSTVWIDPDGIVVKHWKRVSDAAVHPEHVLEALKAGTG